MSTETESTSLTTLEILSAQADENTDALVEIAMRADLSDTELKQLLALRVEVVTDELCRGYADSVPVLSYMLDARNGTDNQVRILGENIRQLDSAIAFFGRKPQGRSGNPNWWEHERTLAESKRAAFSYQLENNHEAVAAFLSVVPYKRDDEFARFRDDETFIRLTTPPRFGSDEPALNPRRAVDAFTHAIAAETDDLDMIANIIRHSHRSSIDKGVFVAKPAITRFANTPEIRDEIFKKGFAELEVAVGVFSDVEDVVAVVSRINSIHGFEVINRAISRIGMLPGLAERLADIPAAIRPLPLHGDLRNEPNAVAKLAGAASEILAAWEGDESATPAIDPNNYEAPWFVQTLLSHYGADDNVRALANRPGVLHDESVAAVAAGVTDSYPVQQAIVAYYPESEEVSKYLAWSYGLLTDGRDNPDTRRDVGAMDPEQRAWAAQAVETTYWARAERRGLPTPTSVAEVDDPNKLAQLLRNNHPAIQEAAKTQIRTLSIAARTGAGQAVTQSATPQHGLR